MSKIKRVIITVCLFLFATTFSRAQIGIGNSNPDPSAVLDVSSTSKGFLVPRMLKADRDAISSPASGLLIFQTDNSPGFYYYDGASWSKLILATDSVANVTGIVPVARGGTGTSNGSITGTGGPGQLTISAGGTSRGVLIQASTSNTGYVALSANAISLNANSSRTGSIELVGRVTIQSSGVGNYLYVYGQAGGTTGWNSTSDATLKNVLQTWESDDTIDFVQYRWKNGPDSGVHHGYLAQDIQKVLPDAVLTGDNGLLSVNYDEVHSFKISNLERKNKEQEARLRELEQTVQEMKKMIKRKRYRK